MRIGTWNLAGRWSSAHLDLILGADCDVWLLTEVSERTVLPGYGLHLSTASIARRRRFAAVASRSPMTSLPDPHPASAAVQVGATTYVSSVLPWRSCPSRWPWEGARHADKTAHAVDDLLVHLRARPHLVWGGDWNHALAGREHAGSIAGRASITAALSGLGLSVPTAEAPHRIEGLLSIDHVAVPASAPASAMGVVAESEGARLSDHDAYVVEVEGLTP